MKKSERAFIIKRILDKKYPKTPIPLDHFDNYSLLIAVLLSAQCTDERVNQITPILFSKASTPFEMSKLTEKQIYNIIVIHRRTCAWTTFAQQVFVFQYRTRDLNNFYLFTCVIL